MTQNMHQREATAEQSASSVAVHEPMTFDDGGRRLARVRINAAGERAVGLVALGAQFSRLSDLLNSPTRFFTLFEDNAEGGVDLDHFRVIAKASVSYVEVVGEARRFGVPKTPGEFVSIELRMASPAVRASAEVFVPAAASLEGVLENQDPFLNLKNVSFHRTLECYHYLAVGKSQLVSITPVRRLGQRAAYCVADDRTVRAFAGLR